MNVAQTHVVEGGRLVELVVPKAVRIVEAAWRCERVVQILTACLAPKQIALTRLVRLLTARDVSVVARCGERQAVETRQVELIVPLIVQVGVEVRIQCHRLLLVHQLVYGRGRARFEIGLVQRLQTQVLAVSASLLQRGVVEDASKRLDNKRVLRARPRQGTVVFRVAPRAQDAFSDRRAGVPPCDALAAIKLMIKVDKLGWRHAQLAARENARILLQRVAFERRVALHKLVQGFPQSLCKQLLFLLVARGWRVFAGLLEYSVLAV